jgi:hypothetical protein
VFYSILPLLIHLYEPLSVSAGWDSLEKQQIGPVNWLQKRAYSSWVPSWAAYTSSIAIAQPLGSRIDVSTFFSYGFLSFFLWSLFCDPCFTLMIDAWMSDLLGSGTCTTVGVVEEGRWKG